MKRLDLDVPPRYVVVDAEQYDERSASVDIRSLFTTIWSGRWTIILVTACATVLGFLATMNIEPTYKASAKVMFDPQLREIAAGGRVPSAVSGEDGIQNEIQVLRSTSLMNRVIEELKLYEIAEFNPAIEQSGLSLLETTFRSFFPEEEEDVIPEPEIPDLQQRIVAMNVAKGLQLTPIPSSRVIEISFVSFDRGISALVANAFAEQYIHDQLEVRLSTTRAATDWLSGRVDEMRVRVQEAERAVGAARSKQSDEAGQSIEITRRQLEAIIDTYSETESAARAALADHERLMSALENEADFGTVPEFRDSELLTGFLLQEINLRNQYANLVRTLPSDHFSILEIKDSLQNVRRLQEEEAARIVEISRARWASLESQTRRIESEIRVLDRKVLQQAQDELNIRQLEREADAGRRVYETFLERLNTASEQVKLESADARILTFAEPPLYTYSQPKKYAFVVAFIGGLLASIILVYLRVKLRNTFRSADEVKHVTGRDVIGMTPILKTSRNPAKIFRDFVEGPNSLIAEAIHGVRTNLLLSGGSKRPRVVLFTSSYPDEGSSVLAALTALSAFRTNGRTVIVDCDLRRPQLYKVLGAGSEKQNIIRVIDGKVPLEQAIRKEPVSGLHVLDGNLDYSASSSSVVDILSSRSFSDMIDTLRETYDLVILNAPPAVLAVDAKVLSEYADSVVYVVRWNKTAREAVAAGLRNFDSVGAPVAGVVLSMVKRMKSGSRRRGQYPFADYNSVQG
jgi:polysaccharide biosynthesis transport protein